MSDGDFRGKGILGEPGVSYWYLAGADALGVVSAKSILADEILYRMQQKSEENDGIIEFPESWIDFQYGKFEHAMGALSFKM